MCRALRTIANWSPKDALREQFSEWEIELVHGMRVVERIIPVAKTCLIDKATYLRGPEVLLSHVWAHLVLHLPKMGGEFTDAQEDEADDLADLMRDDAEHRDGRFWDLRWDPLLIEPADEDAA